MLRSQLYCDHCDQHADRSAHTKFYPKQIEAETELQRVGPDHVDILYLHCDRITRWQSEGNEELQTKQQQTKREREVQTFAFLVLCLLRLVRGTLLDWSYDCFWHGSQSLHNYMLDLLSGGTLLHESHFPTNLLGPGTCATNAYQEKEQNKKVSKTLESVWEKYALGARTRIRLLPCQHGNPGGLAAIFVSIHDHCLLACPD
ncbi:hypothetical protein B566_EDAN005890 [Ephemera danica]|nr:hypothetical protein B566_EDAN005890 [Ephemera danica]